MAKGAEVREGPEATSPARWASGKGDSEAGLQMDTVASAAGGETEGPGKGGL